MSVAQSSAGNKRQYERGDNRLKHVGKRCVPEIARTRDGEPLGLCPVGISDDRRQSLLDEAIGYLTSHPYSAAFPKQLFAVDSDGTIYTGRATAPGASYHAYPYAGRMGKRLISVLRRSAIDKGCEKAFDLWVKSHVTVGGPPDL